MHDLFRREALEAKSNTFLDSTVLRPPFSFAAWAAIRAVVASMAPHPGNPDQNGMSGGPH